MKRLIKWIFFLVLLLIVTALAASFLIPIDSVKKMASERVKAMTGRDLVIAGEVKATFWPNIGVKLEKVTLSNPEGFSDKHMAEIESLNVEIELMPLLH
ncbi:MAG: AsmA family protein, partial [Rickettsiales bacterium]